MTRVAARPDRLISGDDVVAFEDALPRSAKAYELFIYHGARHAFDEHHRAAVYRPVASKSPWQRSLTFLDWHLRGPRNTRAVIIERR